MKKINRCMNSVLWILCGFCPILPSLAQSNSPSVSCNAQQSSPDKLHAKAAVVDEINIHVQPIFDETKPAENNWLFRWVNRLHINTRKGVIKHDLLVKKGDALDPKVLQESERILRSRHYLNRVSVTAADECAANTAVNVDVHQVWTLVPELSFSHAGGNSNFGFGLHDSNFLGYGKTVNISHQSTDERSGELFEYYDPNTGMKDSVLSFKYADNSDGKYESASLVRPFFALNTSWTAGISYDNFTQEDALYNAGEEAYRFAHDGTSDTIFFGGKLPLSSRDSIHRLIFGYTRTEDSFLSVDADQQDGFTPPADRQFNYPWFEYQFVSDGYIKAYNIQQINQVEDINLGAQFRARMGLASSRYPLNDQSYVFQTEYSQGAALTEHQLLLANFSATGAYGDSQFYNTVVQGQIAYHWENFQRGQFYIQLTKAKGFHLFDDAPLALGGDMGLRGYPAHFAAGNNLELLTVEQRYFGEKEWFSLFYLGAAIFYDEGRAWGDSAIPQSENGRLRDVGVGLRLSGTRTGNRDGGSHNVLHIDIASPLDGSSDISSLQWLVKVKKSF